MSYTAHDLLKKDAKLRANLAAALELQHEAFLKYQANTWDETLRHEYELAQNFILELRREILHRLAG